MKTSADVFPTTIILHLGDKTITIEDGKIYSDVSYNIVSKLHELIK